MTILLKQIFGFFKLLNSDKGAVSIAAGVSLGFILGMSPALSLQTLLVFVLMFFFRVQIGAALISAFFFKFVAYLLDPIFHEVGKQVLTNSDLYPIFTTLYHMPIVPLTRFNNTVVMGSGVTAIVMTPIIFFVTKMMVEKYRQTVVEKFQQSKAFKAFKLTGFYKWYVKYDELFG